MRFSFVFLLTCIVCTICNATTGNTWLTFPEGLSHPLVQEADGSTSARIPVTFDSTSSLETKFHVRIFDVRSDSGRSESLTGKFMARLDAATDFHDLALVIRVAPPLTTLKPGTYSVIVHVEPNLGNGRTRPQRVSLTLTRTAPDLPELEVRGATVLSQIKAIDGALESHSGVVRLAEKSRKADVTGLSFSHYLDPQPLRIPDNVRIRVMLNPDKNENTLSAGTTREFVVTPSGEFPLGKTSGKINIYSNELTTPLTATYDIYVRRDLTWLGVLAGAGVLSGLLIRVRLQRLRQNLQARIAASKTMQQINDLLTEIDDPHFQKEGMSIRKSLRLASQLTDPDDITAAVKLAQDSLTKERTALEQRLQPLVDRVNLLHFVLDPNWDLPSAATIVLGQARAEVAKIDKALERRNADEANAWLQKMVRFNLPELAEASGTWASYLGKYLIMLASHPPPLPDGVLTVLREFADSVIAQAPWPYVKPISADEKLVEEGLKTAHSLFHKASRTLQDIVQLSDEFVKWTIRELTIDVNAPIAAELREATQERVRSVENGVSDPAAYLRRWPGMDTEIKQAWLKFMTSLNKPPDIANLNLALSKGAWTEAVALAKTMQPRPPEEIMPSPALMTPPSQGLDILATTTLPTSASFSVFKLPPITGAAAEQQLIQTKIEQIAALQSVFFAILLICGLYVGYGDAWVGTYKEMLAIFLLAFGIDLTSDSVLAAIKKQ